MAAFNEKFMQAIAQAGKDSEEMLAEKGVKIATGSYTGTGNYGEGSKNSLTFGFEPKLVFVSASDGSWRSIFMRNVTKGHGSGEVAPYTYVIPCTWSGKNLTWYLSKITNTSPQPYHQLNAASTTYRYIAIG